MGILRRIFGSVDNRSATPLQVEVVQEVPQDEDGPHESWYVPADGDKERFLPRKGGMPPLHLIRHESGGETVLRLCEDSTGLLVGPTDRRLPAANIYVSNLRGEQYHQEACRAGDFSPGAEVRLVAEPDNPHDPYAVAVYANTGTEVAAYYNKQKARMVSKLLLAGEPLRAVSLRGTPLGHPCQAIAVLAAHPAVVDHLLTPRPSGLPRPAHLR